jgi:predicted kinase
MAREPNLWMLVGVPGSGKSTWIANTFDHVDVHDDVVVASTDDHIMAIAAAYGKTYNEAFADNIKIAEKLMYGCVMNAVEGNCDIIWDQTNLTRKSRAKKLIMIPERYRKIAVVFPTPEPEELERRLVSRPGKTIPQHVINSMIHNFQHPQHAEGFDVICAA